MIITVSKPALEVLRRAQFICVSDLGVSVSAGTDLTPEVTAEIEGLLRTWKLSVREAATAALAGLLELQGLTPQGERPATH